MGGAPPPRSASVGNLPHSVPLCNTIFVQSPTFLEPGVQISRNPRFHRGLRRGARPAARAPEWCNRGCRRREFGRSLARNGLTGRAPTRGHERRGHEQHRRGHEHEGDDELDLRRGLGGLLVQSAGMGGAGLGRLGREGVGEWGAVALGPAQRGHEGGDGRHGQRATSRASASACGTPRSIRAAAARHSPASAPPWRDPTSASARPSGRPASIDTRSRSRTSGSSAAIARPRARVRRAISRSGARNPATGRATAARSGSRPGSAAASGAPPRSAASAPAPLAAITSRASSPSGRPAASRRASRSSGAAGAPRRRPRRTRPATSTGRRPARAARRARGRRVASQPATSTSTGAASAPAPAARPAAAVTRARAPGVGPAAVRRGTAPRRSPPARH